MNKYNPIEAGKLGLSTIFKLRGFAAALAAMVIVSLMAPAHAALDTNITDIVTDLTTFFGSIQTLVISVVVFGLAIGYAKLLSRK